MATDDEAVPNDCIDGLIISVIKSIRNMKKRPDCFCVCDTTEEIVLNCIRLYYLTDNNKIKNKPTNGRDSYYIIDEMPVQFEIPPNSSNELIPSPVSYETPLIKDIEKSSALNRTNENGDAKFDY